MLAHMVARDISTTTGNNLSLIRELTATDPWGTTSSQVKKVLGESERQAQVPEQDAWRLVYLAKLLEQRGELHYNMGDTAELSDLIDSLCVN